MASPLVALIGFHDQGNLGIGYLAATLARAGTSCLVLDVRSGPAALAAELGRAEPAVVGFSLIFQYHLPRFAALARALRDAGVRSLLCVGGHYPTLRWEEVLEAIPELDCVVRGEGELTLRELAARVAGGREWRDLEGIAFRDGAGCRATPPRPLIPDLDGLPYPERPREELAILGRRASPLLASRGCPRACSFCSIREFYRQSPGKPVRVRAPERVADEMDWLTRERGTSIFLFQDDDFPLAGAAGRRWVARFLSALEARRLPGRAVWKISCRADEVEAGLFRRMREAGLYTVYLGLESGNDTGLRALNKGVGVQDNLRAVEALQDLGLAVGYGFMLFDPSSTFASVRENVRFLRRIGAGGEIPAVFCRMLPYAGTPVERRLAAEGRLRGGVASPDYSFLDPALDAYYPALAALLGGWFDGPDSLSAQLNWAWQEHWVLNRLFPPLPGLDRYGDTLRALTLRANTFVLDLIDASARSFPRSGDGFPPSEEVRATREDFAARLLRDRDAFVATHQAELLAALS